MRAFLLGMLLLAPQALAQKDDGAIPYPEDEEQDERNRRELPKKSDATPNVREETDVEAQDRELSMAHLDDPSIGLSGEMLAGVVLLESSRGGGFEAGFMGGIRFTWEWSRTVFSDEFLREYFFVDVLWARNNLAGGTKEVFSDSIEDYFSLAPAFSFPFGKKAWLAAFVQVGVGFALNSSTVNLSFAMPPTTKLSGGKILAQYGLGLRARPLVVQWDKGSLRISFRAELTRFRRGYMDDTFLGGSIGVTF